jgi:hypothetical protein
MEEDSPSQIDRTCSISYTYSQHQRIKEVWRQNLRGGRKLVLGSCCADVQGTDLPGFEDGIIPDAGVQRPLCCKTEAQLDDHCLSVRGTWMMAVMNQTS